MRLSVCAVDAAPPREADIWLERLRRFWSGHLDALATELSRGKRERREQRENTAGGPSTESEDEP